MWAITIRASKAISRYWQIVDAVSAFELHPSARMLDYPAHLTFATYRAVASEQLRHALDSFVGEPPITLRFDTLATFDGPAPVVWLKPQADPRLYDLHKKIHAIVGADQSEPLYRPNAWVPHCTIATAIDPARRDATLRFVAKPLAPISMDFDAADALSYPPPSIMISRSLNP